MTRAYRGYLITIDYLDRCSISKGGAFISWATNEEDAMRQIDSLVE